MSDFYDWFSSMRASKSHRCDVCNRAIRKGEAYEYCKGRSDDQWFVWRECTHCNWLIDEYDLDDGECRPIAESVQDTMEDSCRGDARGLRHLVQFNRKWSRNDGALYPVPESK